MNQADPNYRAPQLVTPPGRLLYDRNLFRPGVPEGVKDAEPAYNCGFLLDKAFASTTPLFSELTTAVKDSARAKWGDGALVKRPDGTAGLAFEFYGLTDGDAKDERSHHHWIINAKCKEQPIVLAPDGTPILADDTRNDLIYRGAYIQLLVRPYFFGGGTTGFRKGGHFWLIAAKLLGGGERLGAAPITADEAGAHFAANVPDKLPPAGVAQAAITAAPAPAIAGPAAAAPAVAQPAAPAQPAAAAPAEIDDIDGDAYENPPW